MAESTNQMWWTSQQAVVTLPAHIDLSNADQIREQLLWIINRGAAVLIADLTGTVSCDYSSAEALARAQHRAVANGTELRLVVTAEVVRRVLRLNGLDRLVPVYPDLDGALAAGAAPREPPGGQVTPAAERATRAEELMDATVHSIFNIGLILRAAIGRSGGVTAQRRTEVLRRLDEAVREIRNHVFAEHGQGAGSRLAGTSCSNLLELSAGALDCSAVLQRHVAQTARAVQSAAADTAALLERRARLLSEPRQIDYPAEIKRWRELADQAARMAQRWE